MPKTPESLPSAEKSPGDVESIDSFEKYGEQVIAELRDIYAQLENETDPEKIEALEADRDAIEELVGATLEELEELVKEGGEVADQGAAVEDADEK